jgi:hypothetical protein
MLYNNKKIGLLDIDSHNFPNLALMKISAWHKSQGDHVEWATMFEDYDIIYKSKIFDFSPDNEYCYKTDRYIQGGSGYDLKSRLPVEIEKITEIDYSIYNIDYSIQLFSRGCIRRCPFCIVGEKEGNIRAVNPMELNPKGKYIQILDNNFFANPKWRSAIEYLKVKNQKVYFHGIDVRIIDEEQCKVLNSLRHISKIHIAWDNAKDTHTLDKIKFMIQFVKPYKIMCYVLIGFDSTEADDLYRINELKTLKIDPFVMPYDKNNNYQKRFARWADHKAIFKTVEWENYQR